MSGYGVPDGLVESVQAQAATEPDRTAILFLEDAHGRTRSWTYRELDIEVRRVAARLQDRYDRGTRALLMCEPGLEYVSGFLGCLYAGIIAVPAYPPSPLVLERSLARLRAVAVDATADFAITTSTLMGFTADMEVHAGGRRLDWFQCDGSEPGSEREWRPSNHERDDVAFLQYTSGSTNDPRGVVVTHGNVADHLHMIRDHYSFGPENTAASWLPPYHDMGLIGGILGPLWWGACSVLMAPDLFLRRPVTWLKAISDYRVDFSPAPNFAYDLCVRRIAPGDRQGLDLSRWRLAINGAEPVRAATIDRFVEAFAPAGFRRQAFWPAYGMAETTLLTTSASVDREKGLLRARRGSIEDGRFEEAGPGEPVQVVVSCGQPPGGTSVLVVDTDTRQPLPENAVGELWVHGSHVAHGYWGRSAESEATFAAQLADGSGPYLRTGDLGFRHGDELVVTGRIKDLIIIRGTNHYPQDIERSVEQAHAALRPGCVAAFALDDRDGDERLALVAEVSADGADDLHDVASCIRRTVVKDHQLESGIIVLIAPRTIPKTSSGKIRRQATRRALVDHHLRVLHRWPAAS